MNSNIWKISKWTYEIDNQTKDVPMIPIDNGESDQFYEKSRRHQINLILCTLCFINIHTNTYFVFKKIIDSLIK